MRPFKEEVVLALLHNTSWMPTFESPEACAEYLSVETPKTTADLIDLQQQVLAVLVDGAATYIVKMVGRDHSF